MVTLGVIPSTKLAKFPVGAVYVVDVLLLELLEVTVAFSLTLTTLFIGFFIIFDEISCLSISTSF